MNETKGEARSARLEAALDKATAGAGITELLDVLERSSGLPGIRPNLDFARAAGVAIAARRGRADAVVRDLLGARGEFPIIVAAQALAQRAIAGLDARGAMKALHDLAGDERHLIRMGISAAVRSVLVAKGEAAVLELSAWTDGYLHAHVVLDAMADREVLDRLPVGAEVLARLEEAFVLADVSPRSAERSQGLRTLREAMPAQVTVFAARFPEVLAWVGDKATTSKRPETREVVERMIIALRRSGLSNAESQRLHDKLAASAPPDRDAARVVHGTRKRSRGRK